MKTYTTNILIFFSLLFAGSVRAGNLVLPQEGREIALGEYQILDDSHIKLRFLPYEGPGFCRKGSLDFDINKSGALPHERVTWLYAYPDLNGCDDLPHDRYVELDGAEALKIEFVDLFVQSVSDFSKNSKLPARVSVNNPIASIECLQKSTWKLDRLYENPVDTILDDPNEASIGDYQLVLAMRAIQKSKDCKTDRLYFIGAIYERERAIRITIMGAVAIPL